MSLKILFRAFNAFQAAAFFSALNLVFILQPCSGEKLRGQFTEELEPVWAARPGFKSRLTPEEAELWAREDAALAFSGMLYGWSFTYGPGDSQRQIPEYLDLKILGEISPGDPGLTLTEIDIKDNNLLAWGNYELSPEQDYRLDEWEYSSFRIINATGFAPLEGGGLPEASGERKNIKFGALEAAMKKAIKSELRQNPANRPRLAKGRICLETPPRYSMNNGRRAANAGFKLQITEIIPFSVY